MKKIKWNKKHHYLWKMIQKEKKDSAMYDFLKGYAPEWHWTSGEYSIISPSGTSGNKYELFDGNEVYRFDSLEQAKLYADSLEFNKK